MNSWKELGLTKKIIVGAVIIVAASFAPELMILVDVGGIDLALGFLIFYFKPTIEWFKRTKQEVLDELQITRDVILNSALARPRVFTLNTMYCSLFLFMTGSLIFSFGFLLPALFIAYSGEGDHLFRFNVIT